MSLLTGDEAFRLAKKLLGESSEGLIGKINNVIQMVTDLTAVVNGKVDKETGKGLSTNDFTNTHKDIVEGLIDVVTPGFDSLPKTFYSPYLKSTCKLVGNAIELSAPKAGDIDWSVSFANGSLTISGTFHGSTATTAKMSVWLPTETITLTNS